MDKKIFLHGKQVLSKKINARSPFLIKLVAGFIFTFAVFLQPSNGFAKNWILEDGNLKVTFNDQLLVLKILDKRCNKLWEQNAAISGFKLQSIDQKKNILLLGFAGKYSFSSSITLSPQSEVEIGLTADTSARMGELTFPSAFKSPANHFLVLTDSEGMLLPVEDQKYPLGNGITYFCGGGLSMAWMGVTDKNFSTGYMAVLETPFDAALRPKRENGTITFEPVWLPSKEKFGYSRKVTYIFFNKGGYIAQCKRYRNYIWTKNRVVSLKDKAQKNPVIKKMVGAVHIYVWDNAREAIFARVLKDSGISKAMFLWDANHAPYPSIDYDDSLKKLGYSTGAYELFTDLKPRDTLYKPQDTTGPLRFSLTSYPGLFDQLSLKKKDGKTVYNQFGHTSNPIAIRPEMIKRINRELKEYSHETYFLDVYQANGLFECYSDNNPLTREQFSNAVIENYKMITEKYGQYLGGEWGADFAAAQTVYVHGMMTLQRTWFNTEISKKGTIYYYGDWKNGQRPSIMLGERTSPPLYMEYSINEAIRAPLYELVYHDAVVTSWRWEDANHHTPEIWWKKDLFNILYGSAPLWSLDHDRWERFKNTFIQSYKNICPWLQQIGYDEMLTHRFLSADRKVQETVFSSGRKAIVNFSESEFTYQNKKISAKGFIFL